MEPVNAAQLTHKATDNGNGRERAGEFFVVGVGASAGGLEALERFFANMPAETGMGFVVVQHLSPDFESLMDELLGHRTKIPIHRVEDGMVVRPDAIYLIPPKKEMIISQGRLLLTDKDPAQGLTLPIDQFFRSLAQDAGSQAVGIVLSGTGSDGSRGIRHIHESGGLVLVQQEETAKFDGMPRSAIDTGVVDAVLSPEEMPASLLKHIDHPLGESPPLAENGIASEEGMNAIFSLLRQEFGIDFSYYKPNTVTRRTERRLSLNHSMDLDEYVEQLRRDPDELSSLYRDLLIGVTQFFRDPEAFDLLCREGISRILAHASGDQEVRIWVAGCATGEEAYSLAMLVQEEIERIKKLVNVKIFATDVHRASLDFASAGVYPETSLSGLSADRRERFFQRHRSGYQVSQDLRKFIVFAPHNIIKDAPFTKLDLITCRNLLIYLQPLAQKKALSLFHFGLKTGGVLFLGPSESPAELSDEFECIDEHWKVFRKRRDIRLPADLRLPLSTGAAFQRFGPPGSRNVTHSDPQLLGAYDGLLESTLPPSLLINEHRQLMHAFGGAERHLSVKGGRSSSDLLDMVDPELRIALSGALQRAAKERTPVVFRGVRIGNGDQQQVVTLNVRPIHNVASNSLCMLVSLEEVDDPPVVATPESELNLAEMSTEQIASLETELRYTKENLQATIEELETSNEELQATNEELVASNEELQSTNEELHSVNEELYTVNAEYQRKITELTELTNDMDNLLESTAIGTIFLDRELCIRKFTPQIGQAFDLRAHDVGRRIETFSHNIHIDTLIDDARQVLESESPLEQEVQDRFGTWFFLRILPYRSKSAVEGVVLTLIDISALKSAEARLTEKDRQLRGILDNSTSIIFVKDLDGCYLLTNRQCHLKLGVSSEEALGQPDSVFLPTEVAREIRRNDLEVMQVGDVCEFEEQVPSPDGPRTFLSVKFPLRDDAGEIYAVGGVCTDISRRKQVEEEQHEAVRRRDRFLAMLSHELRNPLGAIMNAGRVLEQSQTPQTVREARQVISRQSRQMARLLDDLLDVSRIRQNKVEMRRSVVDLHNSVQDAVQAVRPLVDERQHELVIDVTEQPLYMEGDPDRLQQLIVNLLNNAAKYSPVGSTIRLSLWREQGKRC